MNNKYLEKIAFLDNLSDDKKRTLKTFAKISLIGGAAGALGGHLGTAFGKRTRLGAGVGAAIGTFVGSAIPDLHVLHTDLNTQSKQASVNKYLEKIKELA